MRALVCEGRRLRQTGMGLRPGRASSGPNTHDVTGNLTLLTLQAAPPLVLEIGGFEQSGSESNPHELGIV